MSAIAFSWEVVILGALIFRVVVFSAVRWLFQDR